MGHNMGGCCNDNRTAKGTGLVGKSVHQAGLSSAPHESNDSVAIHVQIQLFPEAHMPDLLERPTCFHKGSGLL